MNADDLHALLTNPNIAYEMISNTMSKDNQIMLTLGLLRDIYINKNVDPCVMIIPYKTCYKELSDMADTKIEWLKVTIEKGGEIIHDIN